MPLRTVNDFIRAKAALSVRCENCGHDGYIMPALLREQVGQYGAIARARLKCSKCGSRRVSVRPAADTAAEVKLHKMEYFGGVYAKLED